jgi:cytoplasmic iron level regulating protein YaaA (DUF328/UPF0246 family)
MVTSSDGQTARGRPYICVVLIIVPPSETKRRAPDLGAPVEIEELSFPGLNPLRREIAEALIETSARADAFRRLGLRPSMAAEVARNTHLLELPTLRAFELYSGPLHSGLSFETLSSPATSRARRELVITSALWGAVRASDRIPTYRLSIHGHLVGIGRLDATWRRVLPDVLAEAARDQLTIDLRSAYYQAAGRPRGLGDRTVSVRVPQQAIGRRVGDVVAKRVRGQVARHLLESDADPSDPGELAMLLGERWPIELEAPRGREMPWTMTVIPAD